MSLTTILPTVNASLNLTAGIFLVLGWLAIKQKNPARHKMMMLGALASSAIFLVSYVTYHALKHGVVTRYQGQGVDRVIYFFILITHTPLAVLVVPVSLIAVRFALRGEYAKHTAITRWLMPVWLYVSGTGVLIYLMLYIF